MAPIEVTALPPAPPGRSGWPWSAPKVSAADAAWPRISIVTPSYNQGEYIEETIRSVLLQGYPNLELIVMDGGSNDATLDVIRHYEPWLASWVSERDRGQTHAINKGLAQATGDLFGYLNSDDLLMPGALFAVAEAFRLNPDVDVVHGECIYMDSAGVDQYGMTGRVTDFEQYLRIWERFEQRDYITQPELFCRMSAIRKRGEFREERRSVMDFEMWLRLLSHGHRFLAIDAPVAKFRMHPTQKSAVDPGYELCEVVREYATAGRLTRDAELSVLRDLERARAHLLVRAGIAASMLDLYGTGLKYCGAALAADPRIALSYEFWAVLAHPLRKRLPGSLRGAIRGLIHRGSPGSGVA